MNIRFERYRIENVNGETILLLYLDPILSEFAKEQNFQDPEESRNLTDSINKYIKENLSGIKVTTVKLMLGTMVVATISLGPAQLTAAELNTSYTAQQTSQTIYTVQSGDSIWSISRKFNISMDSIRAANNLSSDTLYIGEKLVIPAQSVTQPVAATYKVVQGDSLYIIAKRFNTTVDQLKKLNNLTTDVINIGQILKLPDAAAVPPAPGVVNYTVAAGDTLWLISRRFNTTVDNIKTLNNLTGDTIHTGQTLKIPTAALQKPIVTYKDYTVVSGDNAWSVSIKFGIPMAELLQVNNLTMNSSLQIGQVLRIPVHYIPVKPTPGSMYGENLDWWTEAQYVVPINKEMRITDFVTGRSFYIKRTIGANHADCEPLTAVDSAIIKDIWGGSYSWKARAVIVAVDGRRIAASMSSMPHNIEYITDNAFDGHFDLHFLNSTRHSDGLIDQSHQEQIKIAAGIK